ncbi:hypothetical protein AQUCO_00500378v1 [Aquilegia coerulea]|uniref:GH16 domain-containing protein n=1 Tax=Aquilegia coerulea TaxID=218851 RepID=A0A2G5ERQ2_AQUCA|nr:hypothetical protein AQUCO_00500378v1 [Aquilegia coerulea]
MAISSSSSKLVFLLWVLGFMSVMSSAAKFDELFEPSWALDHVSFEGEELKLKLDNFSGAGFGSKSKYLFGKTTVQIKLVEGDSAGTVTAFYMSSDGPKHNEFDFEFLVDETPIRVFTNKEKKGVPFPKDQPMGIYSSIWNADDWATQGGRVKTDWSHAPFVASYKGFDINGCECPISTNAVDNTKKCSASEGSLLLLLSVSTGVGRK